VSEVAIVALPSDAWGQKVAAVVVLTEQGKRAGRGGKPWSPLDMRRALKEKLANYKIPQEMKVVESIPRNAMGKSKSTFYILGYLTNPNIVNKKGLVKAIFESS
jgi:malonyl-CoA/methylmalonyl-CoA synthetase